MKMNKKFIDIEIDLLTNSVIGARSGDILPTEFTLVTKTEISSKSWSFNWKSEIKNKNNFVYKMTILGNPTIIQGLISFSMDDGFVFINIVESAVFNRGKNKFFIGVGGNLFAFACLKSFEAGYEGFVVFNTKTNLINHYQNKIGAKLISGQRMILDTDSSNKLMNRYFKNQQL